MSASAVKPFHSLGSLGRSRSSRLGTGAAAGLLAFAAAGVLLPAGLPIGVLLLGVILGSLHGLAAMGIVLIYRSSRIINFAQVEIGGVAAATAVLLVTGNDVPYLIAVPVGLVLALAVGAIVDATVVKRLATAPRLIATVAMVGVGQLLGALQLVLPYLFSDDLESFTAFRTPFEFSRRVGPVLFRGDHLVAVVTACALFVGISWFIGRTRTGTAIRGAAEAPERARLAGIPVRRLSMIAWVVSAGLSGVASLLSAPIVGVSVGSIAGPAALVIPLTAAVLARMESIGRALAFAIALTCLQQAIFWSYPSSAVVNLLLFAIVAIGLAAQRGGAVREGGDLAGSAAAVEPRRLPEGLRRHPNVRRVAATLVAVGAAATLGVPALMSDANVGLAANIVVYCMIVLSALVLTGWSGQVSLGQFALVGVGAAATGALIVETNGDLFLELLIAGLLSSAVAVAIGAFTTRASGIFLGVVTLAAATAFSSYFFSATYFPVWTPASVPRPELFGRISIDSAAAFYYFCLAGLVLVVLLALGFRRSYVGRIVIAARDNERAAAANAIHVPRTRLLAFGFSGFLAGLAGGFYMLSLRGFGFQAFTANESLQIFLLAVIGGLGSVWGALAGAVYGQGVFYYTSGAAELLGTGVGLLFVVLLFPGGLAEVGYRLRDLVLRWIPGVADADGKLDIDGEPDVALTHGPSDARNEATDADSAAPLIDPGHDVPALRWQDLESGYDGVQVLFGASGSVTADDTVCVVGINGVGKTTMLKAIAGVLPAHGGRIELFGEDVTDLPAEERVRRGLVLVVGGAGVFRSLTVEENLQLGAWSRTDAPDAAAASRQRVSDLFPILDERATTRAEMLSGGEQQMLTLAMGLMADPKVLLVDELSLGLAPVVVDKIVTVLNRLRSEGLIVVSVEQSPATASRLADRVLTMARGRILSAERADAKASARTLVSATADIGQRRAAVSEVATPALRVESVSKNFGGVRAVSDVSLEVSTGEFLGIIGANGAGKTTLLDILSGFLVPDTGRVEMLGVDVTTWSPDRRAELGVARVFQHARLFPNLSVRETVAVGLSRLSPVREPIAHILHLPAASRSEAWVFERVDGVLERLGLSDERDTPIRELSTGTRRAVEIGCVIANEPELLFLDEPTAGIGARETADLANVLVNLHRSSGATFVMIEHDVELIARLSDRLICMDLGEVIADGDPQSVLCDDTVLDAYLGPGHDDAPQNGTVRDEARRRRSVPLRADPTLVLD